jgi:hypothetical protein
MRRWHYWISSGTRNPGSARLLIAAVACLRDEGLSNRASDRLLQCRRCSQCFCSDSIPQACNKSRSRCYILDHAVTVTTTARMLHSHARKGKLYDSLSSQSGGRSVHSGIRQGLGDVAILHTLIGPWPFRGPISVPHQLVCRGRTVEHAHLCMYTRAACLELSVLATDAMAERRRCRVRIASPKSCRIPAER